MRALDAFEDHLTELAGVTFGSICEIAEVRGDLKTTRDELDALKDEVNAIKGVRQEVTAIKATVDKSKAQGDLAKEFTKSRNYTDLAKEVVKCDTQVKIPNLPMGESLKNLDEKALVAKVRAKLEVPGSGADIKGLKVTLLKKETKFNDTTQEHTLPVLIHAGSRDNRIKLENKIREAKTLSTSYHWPKVVSDNIKEMRKQLAKYSTRELSLTGKQIRIRPSNDGFYLTISYREGKGKWTVLDTVKIPVSKDMLQGTDAQQPCVSDYFKL